jgi:uncharacterized Rmd1/YagE family protein
MFYCARRNVCQYARLLPPATRLPATALMRQVSHSPPLFLCSNLTSFPQALTALNNDGGGPMDKILGHKKPFSLRKKVKSIRNTPGSGHDDRSSVADVMDKRIDPDFYNSMIMKEDVQIVHGMASAEAYDLKEIYKFLPKNSCEVIGNEVIRYSINNQNWFIFKYGSFVGWDVSEQDVGNLRDSLKTFAIKPSKYQEFEQLDFVVNSSMDESLFVAQGNGMIVIGGEQASINFDQLAFSHGIANSVKLAILETELEHFITQIKDLPEMLSSKYQYKSQVSFDRKDALNRLSSLLKFRAHLNLHSGLLETPDLYWDDSQLESHFNSISDELDIKNRVSTLNKKLDYAKDIAELLKEYLTERHSLALEWCIIVLIAIEVVFGLPLFFKEYGQLLQQWT